MNDLLGNQFGSAGQLTGCSELLECDCDSVEVGGWRGVRAPFAGRVILYNQIGGRLPSSAKPVTWPTRQHIAVLTQFFSRPADSHLRKVAGGAIAAHLEDCCDVLPARRGNVLARNHVPFRLNRAAGHPNRHNNHQAEPHHLRLCHIRGETTTGRKFHIRNHQIAGDIFSCASAPLCLCARN